MAAFYPAPPSGVIGLAGWSSAPAVLPGAASSVGGSGENHRGIVRTGIGAIDDKRHWCVLHFHQLRRIICNLLGYCGNTSDRLPGITDDRIP